MKLTQLEARVLMRAMGNYIVSAHKDTDVTAQAEIEAIYSLMSKACEPRRGGHVAGGLGTPEDGPEIGPHPSPWRCPNCANSEAREKKAREEAEALRAQVNNPDEWWKKQPPQASCFRCLAMEREVQRAKHNAKHQRDLRERAEDRVAEYSQKVGVFERINLERREEIEMLGKRIDGLETVNASLLKQVEATMQERNTLRGAVYEAIFCWSHLTMCADDFDKPAYQALLKAMLSVCQIMGIDEKKRQELARQELR